MRLQPSLHPVGGDQAGGVWRPTILIRKYDVAPRQGLLRVRRKILRQLLHRLKSRIGSNS